MAFPALLFTGVPPIPANATNTLALWTGAAASGGEPSYRNRLDVPNASAGAADGHRRHNTVAFGPAGGRS